MDVRGDYEKDKAGELGRLYFFSMYYSVCNLRLVCFVSIR